MTEVGGGKFRFGGDEKLCMVRKCEEGKFVVRVGGGWVPLLQFLDNNLSNGGVCFKGYLQSIRFKGDSLHLVLGGICTLFRFKGNLPNHLVLRVICCPPLVLVVICTLFGFRDDLPHHLALREICPIIWS